MDKKSIIDRIREIQLSGFSREDLVKTLYLEKYPIFEITETLKISSSELRELAEKLKLFLLRCPVGHRLPEDPALHANDAHYCVECKRWFNEKTLKDEILLEIKRLEERERNIK